jgi:hypothetical protein
MGNIQSNIYNYNYNFEKMQEHIKNKSIIINTLDSNNQECLISGTTSIEDEIKLLNAYLKTNKTILIIIYGKNNSDSSVIKKYKQLQSLGFTNIALYLGGLFEWLLLQDIFGYENFPTTTKTIDILKYK